ncbi:putative adenosine amp deaminase protein [Phaeoacremonium minimum UCRPA7]|uniref:adenosine deaminase n=1 Tax=Phaeoacremonium minimum (strain UCR-PA7) TaxID=1286976 RepID=R8BIX5_PHAM7|nr:putative adenosine amp deaminase protein [Phaeoacremonium minimum UCRPA7]EON99278.1 putative adenosine amp deaminase protein [Phaeoacremonium minimum UCRPA7]
MGTSCSYLDKEDLADDAEKAEQRPEQPQRAHSKLVKTHPHQERFIHPADIPASKPSGFGSRKTNTTTNHKFAMTYNTVAALDVVIDKRRAQFPRIQEPTIAVDTGKAAAVPARLRAYLEERRKTKEREDALSFAWRCTQTASAKQRHAGRILDVLKHNDRIQIYKAQPNQKGLEGQEFPRFPGDHFLHNQTLIEQTKVFRVAKKMPKGAHLHIHFNACLLPYVLIRIAQDMERMFIMSNIPLTAKENWDKCEIQFSILPPEKERPGNLFNPAYINRQTMKFVDFIQEFPTHYPEECIRKSKSPESWAEDWLIDKLVFDEEEAHHWLQTVDGAWEKFNGRTRMMKGLFNYETAYRRYTRLCLEEFIQDNIQYAEIRPNFMETNQVWTDDGTRQIDNVGIMQIITEEYDRFQQETNDYFGGLKVIYCTPRSFSKEHVRYSLNECMQFKKRWPEWIAGYDLVGEENKGHPLGFFIEEFLEFQENCERDGLDIPFLFHCGETLEMGNDTDGNLLDALLLKSKRIGHGFALARHPYIMERMKQENVCLEVCPISNEILGLTPRMNGHTMYNLLANDVHCTVNSDNGTLFRSTLSHDFYQVLIGKTDMDLHGWRQLIEWSLEHSCMSPKELDAVRFEWEKRWEVFLDWIIQTYGDEAKLPDDDE